VFQGVCNQSLKGREESRLFNIPSDAIELSAPITQILHILYRATVRQLSNTHYFKASTSFVFILRHWGICLTTTLHLLIITALSHLARYMAVLYNPRLSSDLRAIQPWEKEMQIDHESLRNAYSCWIFSEKGLLFLTLTEISHSRG
jgi:hypothetical protein